MKGRRLQWGLPLLAKELAEQASRRRTYVVRVVYACLLFLSALLMFSGTLITQGRSPFAVLGQGRELFVSLVNMQFVGIYLFLPATTCGALTLEKERNTLTLLFLTRLGPWTILFEKLLGRIIPMCMFLMMSLPLLAFAYSLGGITPTMLWGGVWALLLAVLQTGTLALMCSAFFRTTVGAFIGTYLLGAAVIFVALPASLIALFFCMGRSLSPGAVLGVRGFDDLALIFFAPAVFESDRDLPAWMVVARGIPILVSSICFLLLARYYVVRRAFVPPADNLLRLFRWLDRLYVRINNNRLTRGIVLMGESARLPGDEPITWRETTKKSLGTFRYLFRILVGLEIPVAVICVLISTNGLESVAYGTSFMLALVWLISILILSVSASSLIAGERTHQTLDVLLTTPLSVRQIVSQKFKGIQRLILVLAIPLLSLHFYHLAWSGTFLPVSGNSQRFIPGAVPIPLYLFNSLSTVLIYLPLAAWISFAMGLRAKTQARAMVASVAIIAGWCILPPVVLISLIPVFQLFHFGPASPVRSLVLQLSPATMIVVNEHGWRAAGGAPWLNSALNFMFYGGCLLLIRNWCLQNADFYLGRRSKDDFVSEELDAPVPAPGLIRQKLRGHA